MNKKSDSLLLWLKKTFRPKMLFGASVLIYTVLSAFYIAYQWTSTRNEITHRAVTVARTVADAIHGEMFLQLRGVKQDLGTRAYESIKKRLVKLIETNHDARFAYILTQRDNKIYFMVDSELVGSKDYSPPGQE